MDIVAARSIGLKPFSMSIACGNYHRGGFRRGKTLEWKQAFFTHNAFSSNALCIIPSRGGLVHQHKENTLLGEK
jgi:hypothetical protein